MFGNSDLNAGRERRSLCALILHLYAHAYTQLGILLLWLHSSVFAQPEAAHSQIMIHSTSTVHGLRYTQGRAMVHVDSVQHRILFPVSRGSQPQQLLR